MSLPVMAAVVALLLLLVVVVVVAMVTTTMKMTVIATMLRSAMRESEVARDGGGSPHVPCGGSPHVPCSIHMHGGGYDVG